MTENRTILGTTLLEWHSAEEKPQMHNEEYGGESWLQSEPLLLADADGTMAVGYCQLSTNDETEFDTACAVRMGTIRMWAVLRKPPFDGANGGERTTTALERL